MSTQDQKLIIPNAPRILTAQNQHDAEIEKLSQLMVMTRMAHINILAEAYLKETGLKGDEVMCVEQHHPDGSVRFFFAKRPAQLINFVPGEAKPAEVVVEQKPPQ